MSNRKISAGTWQSQAHSPASPTEATKPARRNQLGESRWAKSSKATAWPMATRPNGGQHSNYRRSTVIQSTKPTDPSGAPTQKLLPHQRGRRPVSPPQGPPTTSAQAERVTPPHRRNNADDQLVRNDNTSLKRRRLQEERAVATRLSSPNPALEEQVQPALTEAPKLVQAMKMDTSMMAQDTSGRATGKVTSTSVPSGGPSEHAPSPGPVEDDKPSVMIKDVRGEFPHEIWDNQEWNVVPRKAGSRKKPWDSESLPSTKDNDSDREPFIESTTFNHRWVVSWMARVPSMRAVFPDNPPSSKESLDVKEHHDIDPKNGKLVPPVEHPATKRCYSKDYKIAQKLSNQTSESTINRAIARMQRLVERAKKQGQKKQGQEKQEQEKQEQEKQEATRENPYLCRVEAHFRPAHESDMDRVAEIYNQEIRKGWRALDERDVPVAAWRLILQNCRTEKLPFVVAVSNYRNPDIAVEDGNHEVIGFAFLDIASRGINGSLATTAKCSARLYVVVDPEYRRKRVGTALLDAIFKRTSRPYVEKEQSYQFVNPSGDPLYLEKCTAARDYRVIIMEVYIQNMGSMAKTAEGEEFIFLDNFLRAEFHLFLACRTNNFAFSRDGKPLDRLIFEHRVSGMD